MIWRVSALHALLSASCRLVHLTSLNKQVKLTPGGAVYSGVMLFAVPINLCQTIMKNRNLVFKVGGNALQALSGNYGAFSECAGFDQQLLKSGAHIYDTEQKFTLSRVTVLCIYNRLESLVSGPKFPNRTGNEYEGLKDVMKTIESEYKRQYNKSIKDEKCGGLA